MEPSFSSGDFVLLRNLSPKASNIKLGSTLIFRHQRLGLLIKSVKSVNIEEKTVIFVGESSKSISSEDIGVIPISSIIGKPIWTFKRS